jgi:hypothetical protein
MTTFQANIMIFLLAIIAAPIIAHSPAFDVLHLIVLAAVIIGIPVWIILWIVNSFRERFKDASDAPPMTRAERIQLGVGATIAGALLSWALFT